MAHSLLCTWRPFPVSRLALVSFTDVPKMQTLTLLKSQKRDGIRMVSSCSPTGISGVPLLRNAPKAYECRNCAVLCLEYALTT
jgi:hypothetical protein